MKNKLLHFMIEDSRRRCYIAALSGLIFFFSYLVPTAFMMSTRKYESMMDGDIEAYERSIESFSRLFSVGASAFFLVAIMFFAVLTGFNYLLKQSRTDFYHSIPVSRGTVYLGVTLNNLIMVLVPYVGFAVISGSLASARFVTPFPMTAALSMIAENIPRVVLMCGVSTLSIHLAGNLFAALSLNVFFNFYLLAFYYLVHLLFDTFFTTWYDGIDGREEMFMFLSPFIYSVIPDEVFDNEHNWVIAIAALLIGILLLVIGWLLYRVRVLELAGRAIVFKKFETALKFLTVIPLGVLGAMTGFELAAGPAAIFWTVFGLVCFTVISHAILEIIFNSDFKKLFSHKLHLLIAGAVSALIFCVFAFDLVGFDTYKPSSVMLSSAGICCQKVEKNLNEIHRQYYLDHTLSGDRNDIRERRDFSKTEYIDSMKVKDKQLILSIADVAIERIKYRKTHGDTMPYEHADEFVDVIVSYHLVGGMKVRRAYSVPFGEVKDKLERLYSDEGYKAATYPVLGMKEEDLYGIDFEDIFGIHTVDTSRTAMENVLSVYKSEFAEMTMDRRKTEDPVYCLKFNDRQSQEIEDEYKMNSDRVSDYYLKCGLYPIYPSFTGTIEALRSAGVAVDSSRTGNRFRSARVSYGGMDEVFVTESNEEITRLLAAGAPRDLTYKDDVSLKSAPLSVRLDPDFLTLESTGVMDNLLGDNNGGTLYLSLRTKEIPDFVMQRLSLLDIVVEINSTGWDGNQEF